MKHIIVISRKWHNPKISMMLTDEDLSFAIDLVDFIKAVKAEMNGDGNIEDAVDKVVKGIKTESVRIMG